MTRPHDPSETVSATDAHLTPSPAVAWRRVALFYGIALGGAILVGALVRVLSGTALALAGQFLIAVLYMPLPLVAGLVVERVAGRRPLLRDEWARFTGGPGLDNRGPTFERRRGLRANPVRVAVVSAAIPLAIVAAALGVAWLAGALGVPGAGTLVTTDAQLRESLQGVPGVDAAALPPVGVMLAGAMAGGLFAGFTINGLFAFGEEYGWRGVLADELRPLGAVRANLLTGVLWGLWHAPVILLGHNYGDEWGWGIPMMIAWVTPFSFLLWWARERTASIVAPAIIHGAFNGVAGVFTLLVAGGSVLVDPPVGFGMAVAIALVAAVVWRLPAASAASAATAATAASGGGYSASP